MKVLVEENFGTSGNRGAGETEKKVRSEFVWETFSQDVKKFTKGFLYCIISHTGKRIPRQLGTKMYEQGPHEVVKMETSYKWVLTESKI